MKISTVLFVLWIICGLTLANISSISEKENRETKCYDRFSNQIKGQVCYEEVYLNKIFGEVFPILIIGWIILFLITFLILISEP